MLLCQLQAVAMKEQRRDRDVSNGVYLHLATGLFQDTIGTRQPILHSPRYRQEPSPGVLEWLRTFQKFLYTITANRLSLCSSSTYIAGTKVRRKSRILQASSSITSGCNKCQTSIEAWRRRGRRRRERAELAWTHGRQTIGMPRQ